MTWGKMINLSVPLSLSFLLDKISGNSSRPAVGSRGTWEHPGRFLAPSSCPVNASVLFLMRLSPSPLGQSLRYWWALWEGRTWCRPSRLSHLPGLQGTR